MLRQPPFAPSRSRRDPTALSVRDAASPRPRFSPPEPYESTYVDAAPALRLVLRPSVRRSERQPLRRSTHLHRWVRRTRVSASGGRNGLARLELYGTSRPNPKPRRARATHTRPPSPRPRQRRGRADLPRPSRRPLDRRGARRARPARRVGLPPAARSAGRRRRGRGARRAAGIASVGKASSRPSSIASNGWRIVGSRATASTRPSGRANGVPWGRTAAFTAYHPVTSHSQTFWCAGTSAITIPLETPPLRRSNEGSPVLVRVSTLAAGARVIASRPRQG